MLRKFLTAIQWLSWAIAAFVAYAVVDRVMANKWSPAVEALGNSGFFIFGLGCVAWIIKRKI